jgi:hypothetical protein
MKLILRISSSFVTSPLVGLTVLPHLIVFKHPQSVSLFSVTHNILRSYRTTVKIIILYILIFKPLDSTTTLK